MPDNATLYIADPSLLGTRLFNHLSAIKAYEGLSKGNDATGLRVTLEHATITLNFMPSNDIEKHLQGFSGWVNTVLNDNKDQLVYVLSRIRYVNFVMGCVIEPGFDKENTVQNFLFEFNSALNGLLFLHNTIFDYDGQPVAGYFYDRESGLKPQ